MRCIRNVIDDFNKEEEDLMEVIVFNNLRITNDYDGSIEEINWTCEHNIEHVIYNKHGKLLTGSDDCFIKVAGFVEELGLLFDRQSVLVREYGDKIVRVLKVVDEK